MITDDLWTVLRKRIRDEKERQLTHLAAGQLDHPAYRDLCGYLRALDDVEAWARETIKRMTGEQ